MHQIFFLAISSSWWQHVIITYYIILKALVQKIFNLPNPIVLWTSPATGTAALSTTYIGYPPPLELGHVRDVLVERWILKSATGGPTCGILLPICDVFFAHDAHWLWDLGHACIHRRPSSSRIEYDIIVYYAGYG